LSVRFSQQADQFIADKVFPQVGVRNRSDKFFVYDRAYWFRTDAQLRAPGTESAGSGFQLTTDDYACEVFAIHKDVDDQVKANADQVLDLERDATEFVTQQILQKKEQDWVSKYFTTSVWGTDVTGGTNFTVWSDAASTPIENIRTGITTIAQNTAYRPNTLVLGPAVWQKLVDHPDFLDRIKYTQAGIVGPELLASLLGLERVLIPWSVKNTAAEGATAAYSFNFGSHALLAYVPPRAGINIPAAGYTFTWTGLLGAGANGMRMKKFRMEHLNSDRVEGETAYNLKVVSSALGYFFASAV
jgi:hypothetical protein